MRAWIAIALILLLFPRQARSDAEMDAIIECLVSAYAQFDGITALEFCERHLGTKLSYAPMSYEGNTIEGVTVTCSPTCGASGPCLDAFGTCRLERPSLSRAQFAAPGVTSPQNPPPAKRDPTLTHWTISFD